MRIGELAQSTAVSRDSLRFYERLGLIGSRRSANGYRDYPLQVARHARQHGARVFALNSAMGADPESRVFYNRVKGELEAALDALGFPSLVMVRPGLIDGERQERRPGERAALVLSRVLRPLLPRGWRPSRAARIADALVAGVLAPTPGRVLVEAEALA